MKRHIPSKSKQEIVTIIILVNFVHLTNWGLSLSIACHLFVSLEQNVPSICVSLGTQETKFEVIMIQKYKKDKLQNKLSSCNSRKIQWILNAFGGSRMWINYAVIVKFVNIFTSSWKQYIHARAKDFFLQN